MKRIFVPRVIYFEWHLKMLRMLITINPHDHLWSFTTKLKSVQSVKSVVEKIAFRKIRGRLRPFAIN